MWPECATDPDGRALLRAAVANPREETPRWVLADWLQEHGEDEVAEALRASLRTHGQVPLPEGVRARWSPWEECVGGWLGVLRPTPEELSALCVSSPALTPWIT
ncbi:MAG: TIGR02996 domain-containing protein, partial [Gemmataceae bacterium]|nr:TIGR02996 domain-containing protein [Gemmataceae bacterium]